MLKKIIFLVSLFACIFAGSTLLSANSGDNTPITATEEGVCALPGPDSVGVVTFTSNSITVSWPHVIGAMQYKVTAFDLDNNVLLSTNYVQVFAANTIVYTVGNLPASTNIEIGVSASACATGDDFGAPTNITQQTDNVIIGDIAILRTCNPEGGKKIISSSGSAWMVMPIGPNGDNGDYSQAWMKAASQSGSIWSVEFNIAAALCPVNRIKFIYNESNLTGNIKIVENQTASLVQIKSLNGQITYLTISHISHDANSNTMRFLVTAANNTSVYASNCPDCGLAGDPCQSTEGPGDDRSDASGGVVFENTETTIAAVPNPFNDFINIQYQIFEQSTISISLYNAMGQLQRDILRADAVAPGLYSLPTDLSALTAGIYFIAIQTESGRKITTVVKQ